MPDRKSELTLRPDALRRLAQARDPRSAERLQAHYELEIRLADRLRRSATKDRHLVYGEVYAELFASLPDHPQKTIVSDNRQSSLDRHINSIRDYLKPDATFLEIGCGDGAMSARVCKLVKQVYGLDVTDALLARDKMSPNFEFLLTEGINIPLSDGSVDIAFSDQLMEHLHPDDAQRQLHEILRVLKAGGVYWISTPSRLSGPHDISRYFDYEARGFHLKEYDYASLGKVIREAGFKKIRFYFGMRGKQYAIPTPMALAMELSLSVLPHRLRTKVVDNRLGNVLLGINALATK
jgi:SAM-dependent methyltransferase